MDYRAFVMTDSNVMLGKPVFVNTRIPVDLILEKMADGMKAEEVIEAYPALTPKHLAAAFAYSVELIRMEEPVSA